MKFASIIITHFASGDVRSKTMRISLESLFESLDYPCEIVVIDNGGSDEDTAFLINLNKQGKIHTYIRNSENMHFGYARNQGLNLVNSDYIAIVDNDIFYHKGWLTACIKVLEAHPKEKIYATPLYNVSHYKPRHWQGELKVGKEVYRLNMRAGSNCWVTRRKDFEKIGKFLCHRIAGTKWTSMAVQEGYLAAVTPELMVRDMAFRRGYDYRDSLPVRRVLSDKSVVYFNSDEFCTHPDNQSLTFIEQKFFKDE